MKRHETYVCELEVELIRHTAQAEQLAALGARLCYSNASLEDLQDRVEKSEQDAFIRKLIQTGHHSVLEHISFTYAVQGVSRVLLAQLTRHRIASYSVQSQRYVSKRDAYAYVLPPSIRELGENAVQEYEKQMRTMHGWYVAWQQKLGYGEQSNQDARFVLPGASETRLVLTMNARELLHFFRLRVCRRSQWEIRALSEKMLQLSSEVAPAVFATAGPPCVTGDCPEGERGCGQWEAVRQRVRALRRDTGHAAG
ncbi:MAG: FAD-dependent thymidylate synthase [Clostridia bacterium]|nr:FAD-dependent thymidylate synthase [Clostridia bacterium]